MKTQKNPVTLLIILGLWLGLVLGCSSFRKAVEQKRAEREGAGIKISAEDLYKAYESNEASADELYQGKILIVTGTVGTTDTTHPAVILIDVRKKPIVNCFGFTGDDQKDALSKLEFGQMVTVKGKCAGKVLGSPGLNDCVLQ